MKAEQFSKNIIAFDPMIRFVGVMEKSGHLYAHVRREGTQEYLSGRNHEISLSQTAYVVDLRKMFSPELGTLSSVVYIYEKVKLIGVPVKDHILVLSTESSVNADELAGKILKYIKSVESEISLYPPANVVNNEKRDILRNLHESGISEDLIAEQLDLDINTVKALIQEIK